MQRDGSDSDLDPAVDLRVGETLAAGQPIIGAGSATALCAAIAARLVASVARLTLAHDRYRDVWPDVDAIGREADDLRERLGQAAADDAAVVTELIAARRRRDAEGSDVERERLTRDAVLLMKPAIRLPLETAAMTVRVAELSLQLFDRGLHSASSDSGVAAVLALSAAEGSLYLVDQNLGSCAGEVDELRAEAAAVQARVDAIRAETLRRLVTR